MPETRGDERESYYAAPVAAVGVPGVFRARVWYRVTLVVFFGAVAAPLLVLALLNLIGVVTPAGLSPAEAGTAGDVYSAFGLVVGTAAFLLGVQVVAPGGRP